MYCAIEIIKSALILFENFFMIEVVPFACPKRNLLTNIAPIYYSPMVEGVS